MITADELQSIANAQGRGFLKPWKAISMVGTLESMPWLMDHYRVRKWVENCLAMEGFDEKEIDAVADAIMKWLSAK
jgi:hypothetical protein